MQRVRAVLSEYRESLAVIRESALGKAIVATAAISITVTTVFVLAITGIWQTIVADWWHASAVPFLNGETKVPNWGIAAFIRVIILALILFGRNQWLKGAVKSLRAVEASRSATIMECDIAQVRARHTIQEAMLKRAEKTLLFLVGTIADLAQKPHESNMAELMSKALEQAISNILELYGSRISRAHILVIDQQNPHWLTCCAAVNIDPKSLECRHYIGPMTPEAKAKGFTRGAAGEAILAKNYKPKPIMVDPHRL